MSEKPPVNSSGQTSPAPVQKKTHPVKTFFKRVLLFFVTLFILLSIVAVLFYTRTKEKGYKAGILTTFVKSGLLFKTYEGELVISNSSPNFNNAIVTEKWSFSVTNDSVAKRLFDLTSKNVKLYYKEKQQTFPWQGDSKRLVESAEEVK